MDLSILRRNRVHLKETEIPTQKNAKFELPNYYSEKKVD